MDLKLAEEPFDGLMSAIERYGIEVWERPLNLAKTNKRVIVVGCGGSGSVEASYHVGKALAAMEGEVIVVVDEAAKMFDNSTPYRDRPILKAVEQPPKQSG